MLKKMGSFFIGVIMLGLVGILSVLIMARMFLSASSMTDIVKFIMAEEGGIIESVVDDDINYEIVEYINEEEINEELGKFVSDYLKYIGGAPNAKKPSSKGFIKLFEKYIDEYEKDTGNKVDRSEINEVFDELDEELDEIVNEPVDKDVALVFSIVYSDGLIIGLSSAIVVCFVLDYLLRKNLFIVIRHSGIVFTISSIIILAFGMLLKFVLNTNVEELDIALVNGFVNIFNKVGIVELVVGVLLIVVSVVLNKNKKSESDVSNNFLEN